MASIQKAQKTASLLQEALTTSPTPLSSGEETIAVEVLFTSMSCTHDYICFPHFSVPEMGEEGASGVRGPVLFHPPPNCRIREVHCGTQVRLVVIAIRDIAKGEEITVDYSLTDWGENALVRRLTYCQQQMHCSLFHIFNQKVSKSCEVVHSAFLVFLVKTENEHLY